MSAVDSAVRLVTNGACLLANVGDLIVHPQLPIGEKCDRITKVFLHALGMGSAGAETFGCPADVQKVFKGVELVGNMYGFPFELGAFLVRIDREGSWSWKEGAQLIEMIVGRVSKLARLGYEMSSLDEKKYLEMSDEERKKTTRPIYETVQSECGEGTYERLVGEKPIDKEECEKI